MEKQDDDREGTLLNAPGDQSDHHFPPHITTRLFFPTLADLSGLLNASIGSIFGESQLEYLQIHRVRHRPLIGQQPEEQEEITDVNLEESWNAFYDTLPLPLYLPDTPEPVVLNEGEENEKGGLNLKEKGEECISEHQVIPSKLDAFITSHQQERSNKSSSTEDDDGATAKTDASYRRGICVTMFLLGLIIVGNFAGVLIIYLKPGKVGHPYTCKTENCRRMAHWIKSGMDVTVHPCDDFYYFACGGFVKKNPPTIDNSVSDTNEHDQLYTEGIPLNFRENEKIGKFLKKIKTFPENQLLPFYQACIDMRRRNNWGIKPLVNLFAQIRLMSTQAGSYSPQNRYDIARVMGRIFRKTNKLMFVDLDDFADNVILFKISKPSEAVLHSPPEIYAKAMRRCWSYFADDLFVDGEFEIDTIVYLVMKFEAELTIMQSKGAETSVFGFPTRFDEKVPPPAKFHSNFAFRRGIFEWEDLVAAIMDYTPSEYDQYRIFFNLWSSFYNRQDRYYTLLLQDTLKNTPVYTIFRYFQWELMKMHAFDLNKEIQDVMLSIFLKAGQSVIERCFHSVFTNLHVVAAHRYKMLVKDPNNIESNMTAIGDKMIQTYVEMVSQLELPMALKASLLATSKTLRIVMEPVSTLVPHLATYYEGLNCSKNHFANVIQTNSIKARNTLLRATNKPPFDKWLDGEYSLTEVTEKSVAQALSVVRYMHVPFAAMQEPFMGNDLPIFNYAGYGHYLVSYFFIQSALEDLFQIYELNRHVWEPQDEVQVVKDFQKTFMEIMECVIDTQSSIRLRKYPEFPVNPTIRISRMRLLAQTFALELTMHVIDKILNATNSHVLGRSPMHELKHAHDKMTEVFPKYQILPGLEKYTPRQLAFLSIARQTCQTFTETRTEYRMRNGPVLKEIVLKGSFRNSDLFAKVWKCSKKSFMNPVKKCPLLMGAKVQQQFKGDDDDDVTPDLKSMAKPADDKQQ